MGDETFEPRIVGFLCNWCSYAGADLSGVSRIQYPTNLRVIRVMCSGRVDPVLIFEAFQRGIDGVAVLGCHPGDCHYLSGNYQARRKMTMTSKVLEKVGIDPKRMMLDWVSAAEGQRFAQVVTDFTGQVRDLGPGSSDPDFAKKAALGGAIARSVRMRWLVGKEEELLEKGNVYGEKVDGERFDIILDANIAGEYDRQLISGVIKDEARTVREISDATALGAPDVFRYLRDMENMGVVHLTGFEGNRPRYKLVPGEGGGC